MSFNHIYFTVTGYSDTPYHFLENQEFNRILRVSNILINKFKQECLRALIQWILLSIFTNRDTTEHIYMYMDVQQYQLGDF